MNTPITARTPRKKTLEIRRRIRAAAKRLFAERGYDATSVQSIGDVVGMGKQAVRYHYPSKEQLRREVYAEMAQRWSGFVPRLIRAVTSAHPIQDQLVDELGALVDDEPYLAQLVLRDMLEGRGTTESMVTDSLANPLNHCFQDFQELRATGVVRDDVDAAAAFVVILHVIIPVLALATRPTAYEDVTNADWRRVRLREAFRLIRAGLVTQKVA